MKTTITTTTLVLLALAAPAGASLYICQNPDGSDEYRDYPCSSKQRQRGVMHTTAPRPQVPATVPAPLPPAADRGGPGYWEQRHNAGNLTYSQRAEIKKLEREKRRVLEDRQDWLKRNPDSYQSGWPDAAAIRGYDQRIRDIRRGVR